MGRNLKVSNNKKQSSFMRHGIPSLVVYNAVDWQTHKGIDNFFEAANHMQNAKLQNKTRKIEKLVVEQLVDFIKPQKQRNEPKNFADNLAVLVTPATNQFGMIVEVCRKDVAEERYEKSIIKQGKKIPFTGQILSLNAA